MVLIRAIGFLLILFALPSAKSLEGGHGYTIIGGEPANITEFPHQVYIKSEEEGLWCGGSLISSQHVLTMSSCLPYDSYSYSVVGATDDSETGGDKYAIDRITEHPNYDVNLAVIKLRKEIKLSEKANPIALAGSKYKIKDGAKLVASGWGTSTRHSFLPEKYLKKMTISKVSDAECKENFDGINLSNNFCAGDKGKLACWADEGGPLIAKTKKENVLVGVIKSRFFCDDEDDIEKFMLFSRVSEHNKWIKEIIKKDLSEK